MYQSTTNIPPESIDLFYEKFREAIEGVGPAECDFPADDSEYAMDMLYCIRDIQYWNHPKYLFKVCNIFSKNSYVATVQFEGVNAPNTLVARTFRLQDIICINRKVDVLRTGEGNNSINPNLN